MRISLDQFVAEYTKRFAALHQRYQQNPSEIAGNWLLGYIGADNKLSYKTLSNHQWAQRDLRVLVAQKKILGDDMIILAPLSADPTTVPQYVRTAAVTLDDIAVHR